MKKVTNATPKKKTLEYGPNRADGGSNETRPPKYLVSLELHGPTGP